jgi:penicillin-binding protein 1C
VRGASTITEQVVRILHPRKRSLWARCVEGIEARRLERRFSKGEILDFYLNQVPFSARRRGVAQAARYFWDRDLETLSEREQLALAVIVRAPERFDLHRNPNSVNARIATLSERMRNVGVLNEEQHTLITTQSFTPLRGTLPVRAAHFVRFARQRGHDHGDSDRARLRTTLDGALQERAQEILDARVRDLRGEHVTDGALLVIDNTDASIMAWVNAGEFSAENGSQIDAVITPRQPGSTLKPLLYSLAITRGWTAATLIDDAPLSQAVGAGLHSYRNYSRVYYGEIPLRAALGNSLNVPAIKTIQFTGTREFLGFLRGAGFQSLSQLPEYYGEGLALGNGEVTLYELTQAYAALANRGVWRPLRYTFGDSVNERSSSARAVVSPEVASVIGDILADPQARRLEFGSDGLLRFPVETAVKTGTSTDYRDAWAVGYSARYTVGVWMGNLNRSSMREISGARGPALVLRSVFAELERGGESRGLFRSPRLLHREMCSVSGGLAGHDCPRIDEIFVAGTVPTTECARSHTTHNTSDEHQGAIRARLSERAVTASQNAETTLTITMPTPGLHIARDPRIPDNAERFVFEVERLKPDGTLEWIVDGVVVGHSERGKRTYSWELTPGRHLVRARIVGTEGYRESQEVGFLVR